MLKDAIVYLSFVILFDLYACIEFFKIVKGG
jgi:hypothetical protein